MAKFLEHLLDVPASDPDEARRGRLLNILLLGIVVLTLLSLLAAAVYTQLDIFVGDRVVPGSLAMLGGCLIVYLLARTGHSALARWIFVIVFTGVLAASDLPVEIVEGRSTFVLLLPVTLASVLLPPYASFVAAGLSALAVFVLAQVGGVVPNYFLIFATFTLALIAWLSAYGLQRALRDLRALNAELDARVAQRTEALTRANAELEEANQRLKELDRMKSRFVSMTSHELRTPLGAIAGFAGMLQSGSYGPLSERQAHVVDMISNNTERLLALVTDLLDQARIEAGEMTLRPTPFSPAELLAELDTVVRAAVEERGLALFVEVDPAVPEELRGDPRRLQQVLVTFTQSAARFTPEGEVRVRLALPDAEHWAVTVRDTGVGIPDEVLGLIRDPFRPLDDTMEPELRSAGMALSIARELVRLMRGTFAVERLPEGGSVFRAVFPLAQE